MTITFRWSRPRTARCSACSRQLSPCGSSSTAWLGVDIGDGGKPALAQAIRAHGNFAEHAPLALLLIVLAEALGAHHGLIHGLGATLIVARIASAVGLSRSLGPTPPRQAGAGLTIVVIVAASLLILYRSVAGI